MLEAHFTLSAFADEIDPDPAAQIDLLDRHGVKHLELRSIEKTNVLDLSDDQMQRLKTLLDARGYGVSAIGSPIGKVKITDPWEPHEQRFRRALERAHYFNTRLVRIFSYYPPDDFHGDWSPYRGAIMDRLQRKAELAAQAGITLVHENEHRIYGDAPERVADIFRSVRQPNLRAAFDPANFVYGGFDPWEGWQVSKEHTIHFHCKDWVHGETAGRLPGQGHGRIPEILSDAAQAGYRGFITLEPHLLGGGPTGGITGRELFPKAIAALRELLDGLGVKHD